MAKSLAEARRVLKPGGKFIIMLYNRNSLVGFQLWGVYGLLNLQPFVSWEKLFAEHHESPGTKAFSRREMEEFFESFKKVEISNFITPYDLRFSRNRFLPLSLSWLVPPDSGFFWVAKGEK